MRELDAFVESSRRISMISRLGAPANLRYRCNECHHDGENYEDSDEGVDF